MKFLLMTALLLTTLSSFADVSQYSLVDANNEERIVPILRTSVSVKDGLNNFPAGDDNAEINGISACKEITGTVVDIKCQRKILEWKYKTEMPIRIRGTSCVVFCKL